MNIKSCAIKVQERALTLNVRPPKFPRFLPWQAHYSI